MSDKKKAANKKPQKRAMSASRRESLAALGFLTPNLLGFLAFTSIPVIVSFVMAFTHWNIFKPPSWIGLENFASLLWFHYDNGKIATNDPFFWQYVYNTVFLMAGIPLGMAGSLIVALMMNQKLKGIVLLRTIYFLPTVSAGVALLILWKYLYNADIGLINKIIRSVGDIIYASPIVGIGFTAICAVIFALVATGTVAAILALAQWIFERINRPWSDDVFKGLTILAGSAIFILIAVFGSNVHFTVSSFFTDPPDWLGSVAWAKPSLILMGLWGGLGGYNMILYLAALSGVPTSYYEAADIDGANGWSKFWAVTWPMISPTTFFILVMGIIAGFQGGFMQAHVMTGGGPAGSTTTIEYYLYLTAFEKFNMGYASAIAWVLFAVILVITLATWKLGGRVVTYD